MFIHLHKKLQQKHYHIVSTVRSIDLKMTEYFLHFFYHYFRWAPSLHVYVTIDVDFWGGVVLKCDTEGG